jgi:hypothetical protein
MFFRFFSKLILIATFILVLAQSAFASEKNWALYSWVDGDQWHYSLVRDTEKHPDATEVKASETKSVEAIKTRISLLSHGSQITLNPLPVLNLELHQPPSDTVKELERVCSSSRLTLVH